MRICLLTGDGYPYRRDALGDWCHTLVVGLTGCTFELVTLVEGAGAGRRRAPVPAYPRTANVASARTVPTGAPERRAPADATTAAALLCRGLLIEQAYAHQAFTAGLRGLADVAARTRGGPLDGVPLADLLVQAWMTGASTAAVDRLPLPRLSLRDAQTAAVLLHRALDGLGTRLPAADLVHCVGGTVPLLAALAAHWRTATPLLITGPLPETGAQLTTGPSPAVGPFPAIGPSPAVDLSTTGRAGDGHDAPDGDVPLAVRTLVRRFRRAVLRVGCAEAGLVAPMSGHQHAWALRHDTAPHRLVTMPPGTHPDVAHGTRPGVTGSAQPGVTGGAHPCLVYPGDGTEGALAVVLDCFARVLAAEPGTVLHATGVADHRRAACAAQIEQSGLGAAVRLTPGPGDPHPGTDSRGTSWPGTGSPGADRQGAGGPVVVYVPGPGEHPYRLVEAMMAGGAIVGADVADVAETLGGTGVVVAADDPGGLAAACVGLLRRPERRHALGAAARSRALARFTAAHLARGYDALYTDLAAPPPGPAYEMALALPAPRSPSSVFETTQPCP